MSKLNDDILNKVSGGNDDKDDIKSYGRCPHCAIPLKKHGIYYKCTECGGIYDKFGNLIGGN